MFSLVDYNPPVEKFPNVLYQISKSNPPVASYIIALVFPLSHKTTIMWTEDCVSIFYTALRVLFSEVIWACDDDICHPSPEIGKHRSGFVSQGPSQDHSIKDQGSSQNPDALNSSITLPHLYKWYKLSTWKGIYFCNMIKWTSPSGAVLKGKNFI